MAWQDRPYYRDPSSSPTNPLLWLLGGSVPLFTVLGIRVRMHVLMILFIGTKLFFSGMSGGMGPKNAATSMTILFFSVLLHEFGHCFGARWVGGYADEILMWPLGGLAMTHPPRRPWASFFSTAMGPAVNAAICIVTGITLFIFNGGEDSIPWFPLKNGLQSYIPHDNLTYYIWWVFLVNYSLFMFNICLVFYPFDSGRMIQEALWAWVGYHRSMQIATVIGFVGAACVAGYGIIIHSLLLISIAIFGAIECYRQRLQLREMSAEDTGDGIDYSAAYEPHSPPRKRRSRLSQRAIKRARRRAMEARLEQERTDQILAKVSAHGMASLTWSERRALRKATEHIRKRDLEMSK